MSWCTDAPEDETISLFAGFLANPDVPLTQGICVGTRLHNQDTHKSAKTMNSTEFKYKIS